MKFVPRNNIQDVDQLENQLSRSNGTWWRGKCSFLKSVITFLVATGVWMIGFLGFEFDYNVNGYGFPLWMVKCFNLWTRKLCCWKKMLFPSRKLEREWERLWLIWLSFCEEGFYKKRLANGYQKFSFLQCLLATSWLESLLSRAIDLNRIDCLESCTENPWPWWLYLGA